jgi:hypothetical protein
MLQVQIAYQINRDVRAVSVFSVNRLLCGKAAAQMHLPNDIAAYPNRGTSTMSAGFSSRAAAIVVLTCQRSSRCRGREKKL